MADGDLVLQVSVGRLQELCDPAKGDPWGFQITPGEVAQAVEEGRFRATPWKSFPNQFTKEERQYHIERVAYFVVNGWTDPIDLDVGVPSLGCYISWMILDGNHRFYAAVIRNDLAIHSTLSGDLNYAQEILGVQT